MVASTGGERATATPRGEARERILDTAFRLFYAHGVRGVGVDTIVASSGVAKATFYKHFPSKDDLAVAYLDRVDGLWRGPASSGCSTPCSRSGSRTTSTAAPSSTLRPSQRRAALFICAAWSTRRRCAPGSATSPSRGMHVTPTRSLERAP